MKYFKISLYWIFWSREDIICHGQNWPLTAEDNGCLGILCWMETRDKKNLSLILIIFKGMNFYILHQYCSEKDTWELKEVFIRSAPPELAIEGFGTELCCSNISPARTTWDLYDDEGVQSGYTIWEILGNLGKGSENKRIFYGLLPNPPSDPPPVWSFYG